MNDYELCGNEYFSFNGASTDMSVVDFWQWHFCDRFDLQDKIAEFIVAKALGLDAADNVGLWTLFDILYRDKRIEVKETSYYHSWQTDDEPKSQSRSFGITKAYSEYKNPNSTYERQNDIYVFVLNTGYTREESDPLKLEHWEFYVVPTEIINRECGDAKSIGLPRLRKLAEPVDYNRLKDTIDSCINNMR